MSIALSMSHPGLVEILHNLDVGHLAVLRQGHSQKAEGHNVPQHYTLEGGKAARQSLLFTLGSLFPLKESVIRFQKMFFYVPQTPGSQKSTLFGIKCVRKSHQCVVSSPYLVTKRRAAPRSFGLLSGHVLIYMTAVAQ